MVTDILTVKNGELVNILLSDVTGVSSEIAPFSSLYPEDINGDGITEVPHPEPIPAWGNVGEDPCRRIDWYTYTSDGTKAAVVSTYHSVEDGWYLRLPDVWKDQILITRTAGTEEVTVTFSYRETAGSHHRMSCGSPSSQAPAARPEPPGAAGSSCAVCRRSSTRPSFWTQMGAGNTA